MRDQTMDLKFNSAFDQRMKKIIIETISYNGYILDGDYIQSEQQG